MLAGCTVLAGCTGITGALAVIGGADREIANALLLGLRLGELSIQSVRA